VLITKALRDEGTSYHYLPPSDYASLDKGLLGMFEHVFAESAVSVHRGATWTTDAPFRETSLAVERALGEGICAVEMEAAALYAFAHARRKPVVCFAHVTNRMGNVEGDFEKGESAGSRDALRVIATTAKAWLPRTNAQ
jgi:uridine phosphorylase